MYLRYMEILCSQIVEGIVEPIRFVDFAVGLFPEFATKSAVKKGIRNKRFLRNGMVATTGNWIENGDQIDLLTSRAKPRGYLMDIEIVFEDDYLAVVHKPAGLVVSGNQFKTLENCLVDVLASTQEDALPWALPVHRLDAATSGLVLFAKTRAVRRMLGEMFEQGKFQKEYHAIVHGELNSQEMNEPIEGKPSKSKIEWLESVPSLKNGKLSLVKLNPITGRTHQLRIHCAHLGASIVGDKIYNGEQGTFTHKGLFLAATNLHFKHPITEEDLDIGMSIPEKFYSLLRRETSRWENHLTRSKVPPK